MKGRSVFSRLKFESGAHRVQRVPDTETQGRIHTSAATVAVLPEAEEVDIAINEADLKIDQVWVVGARKFNRLNAVGGLERGVAVRLQQIDRSIN